MLQTVAENCIHNYHHTQKKTPPIRVVFSFGRLRDSKNQDAVRVNTAADGSTEANFTICLRQIATSPFCHTNQKYDKMMSKLMSALRKVQRAQFHFPYSSFFRTIKSQAPPYEVPVLSAMPVRRSDAGAVDFLCARFLQDPGSFADGGTCGDDVLQQKHSFVLYQLCVYRPVSASHIPAAGLHAAQAGLAAVMAALVQQLHRRTPQVLAHLLGQQFHLVVAPLHSAQKANGYPGNHIVTHPGFPQHFGHLPAVGQAVIATVIKLIPHQRATDLPTVLPQGQPALQVGNTPGRKGKDLCRNFARLAKISPIICQKAAAQYALGRV